MLSMKGRVFAIALTLPATSLHAAQSVQAAADAMTEYRLTALVGFPPDTTIAAAGPVYGGTVERFPRIRWVLANPGGTIL